MHGARAAVEGRDDDIAFARAHAGDFAQRAVDGRDALVGVALFLTLLAKKGKTVSQLKQEYPQYSIAKNKIQLTPDIDVDAILAAVKEQYKDERITDIDGVKIDFADCWVHLRKSNTEPIIRIYSEADTIEKANDIANQIKAVVSKITGRPC